MTPSAPHTGLYSSLTQLQAALQLTVRRSSTQELQRPSREDDANTAAVVSQTTLVKTNRCQGKTLKDATEKGHKETVGRGRKLLCNLLFHSRS